MDPYFDIYFELKKYEGNIKINEPNKCTELIWSDINNLPEDMIDFEKEAIKMNNRGIKFGTIEIVDEYIN